MPQPFSLSSDFADPASGAVVLDSGPLHAGQYDIEAELFLATGATGGTTFLVQHRNAANDANIFELTRNTPAAGASAVMKLSRKLTFGQRLRVVLVGDITGSVQAVLSGSRVTSAPAY